MAEIKSTMDLINEKVRGLKITSEEKKEFRKAKMKEVAQEFFHRYFVQDDTRNLLMPSLGQLYRLPIRRSDYSEAWAQI